MQFRLDERVTWREVLIEDDALDRFAAVGRRDREIELCRLLAEREPKVRWKGFFNERFVDEEMIALAGAAGCDLFIFGPDGGDARTLQAYRKAFDVARMNAAYALCRRERMPYKCAFMMNGP